jgi:hypothetical protein
MGDFPEDCEMQAALRRMAFAGLVVLMLIGPPVMALSAGSDGVRGEAGVSEAQGPVLYLFSPFRSGEDAAAALMRGGVAAIYQTPLGLAALGAPADAAQLTALRRQGLIWAIDARVFAGCGA